MLKKHQFFFFIMLICVGCDRNVGSIKQVNKSVLMESLRCHFDVSDATVYFKGDTIVFTVETDTNLKVTQTYWFAQDSTNNYKEIENDASMSMSDIHGYFAIDGLLSDYNNWPNLNATIEDSVNLSYRQDIDSHAYIVCGRDSQDLRLRVYDKLTGDILDERILSSIEHIVISSIPFVIHNNSRYHLLNDKVLLLNLLPGGRQNMIEIVVYELKS